MAKVVDHKGNEFNSMREMATHWNLNVRMVMSRLKRGWSLEEALTREPIRKAVGTKKADEVNNKFAKEIMKKHKNHGSHSEAVKDMREHFGIDPEKIVYRKGDTDKKYELTDEITTEYIYNKNTKYGHELIKLYRIRALKDFGDVKAGDLGGFIQCEDNLSHEGNCWVYNDAEVYENARVYGDAKVSNNACISENAQVFENAEIFGDSRIYGNAKVYGHAHALDINEIYDNVEVYDNTRVVHCELYGNAKVYDNAHIGGIVAGDNVCICKETKVFGMGTMLIEGNAYITSIDDLMYVNISGNNTYFFRLKNGNVGVSDENNYCDLEDYKNASESNSEKLAIAQLAEIHFSK